MRSTGWIKISRQIKEWQHYKDANVFRVFMELLLSASTKDRSVHGKKLQQGQIITNLETIMEALDMSKHTVMDAINILIESGEIKRDRQGNSTIITIKNFSLYQRGANSAPPRSAKIAPRFEERSAKIAPRHGAKFAPPLPINEDNKLSSITRMDIQECANAHYIGASGGVENAPKIGFEKFGTDGLVELKPVEHRTLVETFGEEKVRAAIEDLNDKLAAGGDDSLTNAKSHFHVLRYWLRYRKDNPQKSNTLNVDLNIMKR